MLLTPNQLPIIQCNATMPLVDCALHIPTNLGRMRLVVLASNSSLYRLGRFSPDVLEPANEKYRNGRFCPYVDPSEYGIYYTSETPMTAGAECNILVSRDLKNNSKITWIKNQLDNAGNPMPSYSLVTLNVLKTCLFVDLNDNDTAKLFGLNRNDYRASHYQETQSAATNIFRWLQSIVQPLPIPIVGLSHFTKQQHIEGRNFNFFGQNLDQILSVKSIDDPDFSGIASTVVDLE
jgi:hypothetical protein